MEATKESGNGAAAPGTVRDFYLVDPATKQKHFVREMTAAQLASFRAGVAHMSMEKTKAVITRLQFIADPLNANMLINMFETAMTTAALLMVIEYEQNRRINGGALPDHVLDRITNAVMDMAPSANDYLGRPITSVALRATIKTAVEAK
jgi:hypothetical protein